MKKSVLIILILPFVAGIMMTQNKTALVNGYRKYTTEFSPLSEPVSEARAYGHRPGEH